MSWADVPLWSLYRRVDRSGRPDLPLLSVYRDHGVVLREGREDNYNRPGADLSRYKIVRKGDLVINKMKTWQGSLGISAFDGIVSPAYFVAQRVGHVDDRFMHHILRSQPLIAEYGARSKGIRPAQWDLPWDEFSSIKVRLPHFGTQRAIADHLDTETSHIDTLISKKRRMIELVEERRRAELTAAVFTDQSTAWGAIRHVVDLLPGYAFPSASFVDVGIRLLRGANIAPGQLRWEEDVVHVAPAKRRGLSDYELAEGDLVFGMDRPFIGSGVRIAPVKAVDLPCLLVQRVARIRATERTDPRYIRLLIESDAFAAHLSPITTGVSVPHVSADQILSFRAPLPPYDAQHTLANRLEQKHGRMAVLRDRLTAQIGLLMERRKALITAAVTGDSYLQ